MEIITGLWVMIIQKINQIMNEKMSKLLGW